MKKTASLLAYGSVALLSLVTFVTVRHSAGDLAGRPSLAPSPPSAASPRAGGAPRASGISAPPPAPAASSLAAAPFDANAVVERVHFAFRDDHGALRGGHTTYASSVGPRGEVTVRPLARSRAKTNAPRELSLETSAVRRGDHALANAAPRVDTDERAAVVVHRGEIDEYVRNTKEGVEQSWSFGARPSGAGDVVVSVRASGLPFAGASEGGLHFASKGGLGVRYGQATWVDARGVRTAVRAERTSDGIALRVPSEVIDASAYPAVLDPVVGPEQGVDTPVSAATYDAYLPAVAGGDGAFLVAWEEYHLDGLTTDVRGARVRASDGAVLDPSGIALGVTANDESSPAVAFGSGQFLVAWTSGPRADSSAARDVRLARVASGTGAVLDQGGKVVATGATEDEFRAVVLASQGAEALLAWNTGTNMVARRVSTQTGALLGAANLALPARQGTGLVLYPTATAGNGGYFVTWIEDDSSATTAALRGARVSSADVVAPVQNHLADTSFPMFASAAYGAGTFVVAYNAPRTSPHAAAIRVDEATGTPGTELALDAAPGWGSIAVGCDGASCAALWPQTSASGLHLVGRALNAATADLGAVVDLAAIPGYTEATVALTSGALLTAFRGADDTNALLARRVRLSDVTALDTATIAVSHGRSSAQAPALMASGQTYFVAWGDTRGDEGELLAARVDAQGALLDKAPLVLSPTRPAYPTCFAAGAGPAQFAVAWRQSDGSLQARTIGVADGALSSTFTVAPAAATTGNQIYVAVHGTTALVTWNGPSSGEQFNGSLVDLAHATAAPPVVLVSIPSGNFNEYAPVATPGGFDVVGWTWDSAVSTNSPLTVRTVDATTAAVGAPSTIMQSSRDYLTFTVTASADRALVAWSCNAAVCAVRYDLATHAALDAAPVTIPSPTTIPYDYTTSIAAANDGASAYVVWQPGEFKGAFDVVGARVRLADGAVLDSAPIAIASSAADEMTPRVACTGPRACLVAYAKFDDSPAVLSQHLKVRTLTGVGAGGACTVTDDCTAGTCVDGVCCASACGGGAPNDCMACNVAGHEGACVAVPAAPAIVCRASTGACDVAEVCDGASTACPSDGSAKQGTACDDDGSPCSLDVCDAKGTCTHPAGNKGATCRAVAGDCDVAEVCTGSNATCPADGFASATLACRAASCTGEVATLAATCTGTAAACPVPVTQSCAPYLCGATACAGDCKVSTDCVSGDECVAGVCVPRSPPGHACTGADQCASGFCVDGVCCETACEGGSTDCQACNTPAHPGTCSPIAKGTQCRAGSCVGETSTPPATCDGVSGVCPVAEPVSCDPFACVDDHCAASCVGIQQCAEGFVCAHGKCVAPTYADAGPDTGPTPVTTPVGGDGGAPNTVTTTSDASGCACDVVGPSRSGSRALGAIAIAGLALVRRRKRGARAHAAR